MVCSDSFDEFLEAAIVDVCFAPFFYRIAIEVLRTDERKIGSARDACCPECVKATHNFILLPHGADAARV